ncbi:MAG: ribosome silencing factor [Planctomycetota bacterium]
MSRNDPVQFAVEIAQIVSENKSEDVVAIDLRGLSSVTDLVVICTGTSDRQMRAVADRVVEFAKKIGEKPYGLCGYDSASWIVVDFVDVVVHIFGRPFREYYDLELLWGDAPHLDWSRSESA